MKIETAFNIKEEVKIIKLNLTGRIVAIEYSMLGLQYKVDYFGNSEIKSVWLFEEDIEPIANTTKKAPTAYIPNDEMHLKQTTSCIVNY